MLLYPRYALALFALHLKTIPSRSTPFSSKFCLCAPDDVFSTICHYLRVDLRCLQVSEGAASQSGASISQVCVGVVCAPLKTIPSRSTPFSSKFCLCAPDDVFSTIFHHLRVDLRDLQVSEGAVSQSGASMSQVRAGVVCAPFENDPIELCLLHCLFLSVGRKGGSSAR